jgi:hypothetical protein
LLSHSGTRKSQVGAKEHNFSSSIIIYIDGFMRMNFRRHAEASRPAMLAAITGIITLLATGCSGVRAPHSANANAPGLNEDAPLSSRGGANPNAPFALVDRSARLEKRPAVLDIGNAEPCQASQLSLFESGAQMDGDHRLVRLSLVNRGNAACKLAGYPAVSLLRQDGTLIGSIAIEKVTAVSIEASVKSGAAGVQGTSFEAPSPLVMIAPAGEATFEVGWKHGENCDQVGAISVAAPGTLESFTVHHPLRVCEGRIMVTAVRSGSSV